MTRAGVPGRPPASVAILSPGTSVFDSRAHRIARSLVAQGDRVTIYSRRKQGAAAEEWVDGYRIVRIPLSRSDVGAGARDARDGRPAARTGRAPGTRGPIRRLRASITGILREAHRVWLERSDQVSVIRRFRAFPLRPMGWGRWFERQVEPHDIWHGMWAGSLPALARVRRRHGGRTVYDARDVYLRSLQFGNMPAWQRRLITPFERHWAHQAGAVIQVSEEYAGMMRRDLGLRDVPVVRNCPDRWEPPTPRPDLIRALLGLPASTAIVLYQGGLLVDRGIERSMDAIVDLPGAVLVLMGFGNQEGRFRQLSIEPPYAGRVFVIDAVPPQDLLAWSASSDIMVMCYPPDTENHRFVTPQKLWEAMAAGVPVVASDMPGFASVVGPVDCGVLCDPTSSVAIADAIRRLLMLGPDGLREMGDRGHAAAQDRFNWEVQFQVLDDVYTRLLGAPA